KNRQDDAGNALDYLHERRPKSGKKTRETVTLQEFTAIQRQGRRDTIILLHDLGQDIGAIARVIEILPVCHPVGNARHLEGANRYAVEIRRIGCSLQRVTAENAYRLAGV